MGPRLREFRLPTPSGRGGELTQPRAHLLADPCRHFRKKQPQVEKVIHLLSGLLRHVARAHQPRLVPLRHQLRDRNVLPHPPHRPRRRGRPQGLRGVSRRRLLHCRASAKKGESKNIDLTAAKAVCPHLFGCADSLD